MMLVECMPDVWDPSQACPLQLTLDTTPNGETAEVRDSQTQALLATAHQQVDSPDHVRFFQGKGGFCAVVLSGDLILFALPGSTLRLETTVVELPGAFICGKPAHQIYPHPTAPIQFWTDQAMILGAGLATRFEPISGDTTGYSKPAVPLLGSLSVIGSIVEHLKRHGICRVAINTFYKPESLKQQLAHHRDIRIAYIDEAQPSGTAGGMAQALETGKLDPARPTLVILGDAITDAHFSFLVQTHQERGAWVTIGGEIVSDAEVHKFGMIETDQSGDDGQSGHVTSFKEKPSLAEAGATRFANAGFYVMAPESTPLFLETWRRCQAEHRIYDFAHDFFPAMLTYSRQHPEAVFWAQSVGGYWSDMGNPTQYLEAVRDVAAGRLAIPLPQDSRRFYREEVVYWPDTQAIADRRQLHLTGNVIVARRFA